MMRFFTVLFLGISVFAFAQKKKKFDLDVVSNVDAKAIVLKPLGNNTYSNDLEIFYGFGFGGNLMTPINFGIGLDYNVLFSNVKYGREHLYGGISSPVFTILDVFLTHRDILSEDFSLEEMIGYSYYRNTNQYTNDKNQKYVNSGSGINAGAKLIYTLDREGIQQFFLAAKFNYFKTGVYNENTEIQKYYARSYFLSLAIGYRYNF